MSACRGTTSSVLVPSAESQTLRNELAALVTDDRASTNLADRVAYARDLWPRQQIRTRAGEAAVAPPAVVVWPANMREVADVLRFAAERGIPAVPFGAGSGVCGGICPDERTILIDVKRMDAIVELDADTLTCRVGAGIIGQNLENQLNARGFTFGHFPSSIYCSTLGGWIACRAAGQTSGRYGKIEDRVLGLSFVDGSGKIWRTDAEGENRALLPLALGSEGVLGVVTEATLRLDPLPEERQFSSWLFAGTHDGLEAIRRIYQAGLRPAVARLYDPFDSLISRSFKSQGRTDESDEPEEFRGPSLGMRSLVRLIRHPGAINRLIDIADPVLGGAKLVLVWEDDPAIARAERHEAERICAEFGARNTGEAPARHWLAHRHSISYRQSAFFTAGAFIDTMEVAATWSRMWPMYEAVRAALSRHVFVMAHFSHAYPEGASIYFTFAGSAASDEEALRRYDETWQSALQAVVGAGGTLSHHHGVGRSKAPMMRQEQGAAVAMVGRIKRALDPASILNVGSLIPNAPNAAVPPTPTRSFFEEIQQHLPQALGNEEDQAVLRPSTAEAVAYIVRLANGTGVRLAPPGSDASEQTVRLSLARLTEILSTDTTSRILHAGAGTTLAALQNAARTHGWTLRVPEEFQTEAVGAWLARGAPGRVDKNDDPVLQQVAGLDLVLPSGELTSIRPAPRRAVGPDLVEAAIGARGRLGVIVGVHLVAQAATTETHLAFAFRDSQSAARALAWARGRGVRPLRATCVGAVLQAVVDTGSARGAAAVEVLTRVAEEHGGVSRPAAPWVSQQAASGSSAELFAVLARESDPRGVFGDVPTKKDA